MQLNTSGCRRSGLGPRPRARSGTSWPPVGVTCPVPASIPADESPIAAGVAIDLHEVFVLLLEHLARGRCTFSERGHRDRALTGRWKGLGRFGLPGHRDRPDPGMDLARSGRLAASRCYSD